MTLDLDLIFLSLDLNLDLIFPHLDLDRLCSSSDLDLYLLFLSLDLDLTILSLDLYLELISPHLEHRSRSNFFKFSDAWFDLDSISSGSIAQAMSNQNKIVHSLIFTHFSRPKKEIWHEHFQQNN